MPVILCRLENLNVRLGPDSSVLARRDKPGLISLPRKWRNDTMTRIKTEANTPWFPGVPQSQTRMYLDAISEAMGQIQTQENS